MRPPDLLTETDFLTREFTAPANPLRPLALLSPEPDAAIGSVVRQVERIADLGFGGIVLDPAASSRQFLGETWFKLVGEYIEAARLAGLAVWLLDGFTNGEAFTAILDEAIPGWRGPMDGPDWADGGISSRWLAVGFERYQELFGADLGRTVRGFFVLCPTCGNKDAANPFSFAHRRMDRADDSGRFGRIAETIGRSYLAPLREWCWRNRLRIAGYRLGGRPLPGLMSGFDLGGLPDLSPGAIPDRFETAGLAGLARYYRQEKVVCQLPLTGEMIRDRAAISSLAAAGANLFLARPPAEMPAGCIAAINDFAARVVMAVSAGGPIEEAALVIKEDPEALHEVGMQIEALAAKGLESVCLPAAESVSLGEVNAHNSAIGLEAAAFSAEETAAAGLCPDLPPHFALRARKVENWSVYTLFNLGGERWLGPVELPAQGAAELWLPANGEQRPLPVTSGKTGIRIPAAIGPGEAVLAVIKKPGLSRVQAKSRRIRARLRLSRSWAFEAKGGNVLPLTWREEKSGHWTASLFAQVVPADLRLAGRPPEGLLLNGEPLTGRELGDLVRPGGNRFECRGERPIPGGVVTGGFACLGEAGIAPVSEISGPWPLNGYPYFRGPGIYRQTVQVDEVLLRDDLEVWLEIGALAEAAAIRLNGEPVGFLAWPPFRLKLGKAIRLAPGGNQLEIEVYAAATQGPWSLKGLLGEVSLIFIEAEPEPNEEWPFG